MYRTIESHSQIIRCLSGEMLVSLCRDHHYWTEVYDGTLTSILGFSHEFPIYCATIESQVDHAVLNTGGLINRTCYVSNYVRCIDDRRMFTSRCKLYSIPKHIRVVRFWVVGAGQKLNHHTSSMDDKLRMVKCPSGHIVVTRWERGKYYLSVLDRNLNESILSKYCRSYVVSARVRIVGGTLTLKVRYDDSSKKTTRVPADISTYCSMREHEVMHRGDWVYKVPTHLHDLFNHKSRIYYVHPMMNILIMPFRREPILKYRTHMLRCISMLSGMVIRDVVREIVVRCCELFRALDFESYATGIA